jgi:uncharacterized membrane protein
VKHRWFHGGLLLLWCAIAFGLRFTNLTLKPLWTDEFSTLVFGLGHSFQTVPLDQVISADVLLQPLAPQPETGVQAVVKRLLTESNHPPLYFILTHGWLQLFPIEQPVMLSWAARSLSALFGVLTVPAVFLLGWVGFQSKRVGQIAAALMAVSPFGIYLAQEARHYTLPTIWGSLSLCCFVQAAAAIRDRTRLPLWLILAWIGVNGLGIATHYFFAFVVAAQACVLLGFLVADRQGRWKDWSRPPWWQLWAAGLGTLATSLVWLPFLGGIHDSELTWWIYRQEGRIGLDWLQPVAETLAGLVTMFYLLPIQGISQTVLIGSGIGLLLLTIWVGTIWVRGLRQYGALARRQGQHLTGLWAIGGFFVSAIALMWVPTYGMNMSLTNGFRYNFIYFAAAVVLLAVALSVGWQSEGWQSGGWRSEERSNPSRLRRWPTVAIWLLGLGGSLVVLLNSGYQKTHRPDLVVNTIRQYSQDPVLIALSHQTHGQTGRLMGIAQDWKQRQQELPKLNPQYILDHSPCASKDDFSCQNPTPKLRQTLAALPRPFDLWLVNFHSNANLRNVGCLPAPPLETQRVDGYRFYRYRCQ